MDQPQTRRQQVTARRRKQQLSPRKNALLQTTIATNLGDSESVRRLREAAKAFIKRGRTTYRDLAMYEKM